jgi:hypothetical protein
MNRGAGMHRGQSGDWRDHVRRGVRAVVTNAAPFARRGVRAVAIGATSLALGAGLSAAQAAWDAPLLVPPAAPDGLGIFLMGVDDGGLGVAALYRSPLWNYGVRAGIAEASRDGGVSIFGGVDYGARLARATPDFPVDVDWVVGAGLSFHDNVRISVPLGLTAGRSLPADGAVFTPYITPRVVFDAFIGGDRPRSSALGLAVDIGLDVDAVPGFLIRFGATLGRRDAVALGLHF